MNFKTTIVLVLLLVIVGGFYYLMPRNEEGQTFKKITGEGEGLFTVDQFPLESIQSILVEQGGSRVKLDKEGGQWWQTTPVRFRLQDWAAEQQIVSPVGRLRYSTRSKPGEGDFPTLGQINLDQPLATVTFKFNDEKSPQQVIRVGKKVGQYCYVMINDDPYVYAVSSEIYRQVVEQGVNDWRMKAIEWPKAQHATGLVLSHGDIEVQLVKNNGEWSLAGAAAGRADRFKINAFIESVRGLSITRFVEDQPAALSKFGLDAPSVTLEVSSPGTASADAERQVVALHVGGATDLTNEHYFATVQRLGHGTEASSSKDFVVFEISKQSRDALTQATADFRDGRIVTASPADVRKVEITQPAQGPLVLSKEADGWKYLSPQSDYETDYSAMTAFLETLAAVRAMDYQASSDIAQGTPLVTLTLTAIGQTQPETMRIYKHGDGDASGYFAIRNDEATAYAVNQDVLTHVLVPPVAFRDRAVYAMEPDTIAAMTLKRPNGVVFEFESFAPDTAAGETQRRAWRLKNGAKYEIEARRNLVALFTDLRAESWQAMEPVNGVEITITPREGEPVTMTIDPDSGRAVASNQPGGVLRVSDALAAAIDAEFRDRTVLPWIVDELQQITVIVGGDETKVSRAGGKFVDEQNNPLDPKGAGGLFDALGPLRVERYIPAVSIKPEDVAATVRVQTVGGEVATLRIIPRIRQTSIVTVEPPFGDHRDWFELDEATTQKLLAKLR